VLNGMVWAAGITSKDCREPTMRAPIHAGLVVVSVCACSSRCLRA